MSSDLSKLKSRGGSKYNWSKQVQCIHWPPPPPILDARRITRIGFAPARPSVHVRDTYAMHLMFEGKHEQPECP